MSIHYSNVSFLKSAATLKDLPADEGAEVAFIGRSNAGKSSAINTITGIKNLARASKVPGRTQLINLFSLDDDRRLVDLPGYGYAKVPLAIKEAWHKTVNDYLKLRNCLKGLVIVMDVRHPLKDPDKQLIEWTVACKVPLHILLTKCDKLKNSEQKTTLKTVTDAAKNYSDNISVQLFSSLNRTGLEQAHQRLLELFN